MIVIGTAAVIVGGDVFFHVKESSAAVMEHPAYITIGGGYYSTSLTELDLSNMDLRNEDIASLRYMTNLTVLFLSNNQISNITPLSTLTNLTELSLSSIQISDITPLSTLMNLDWLFLYNNQIRDWGPVRHVAQVAGR